MVEWYYRARGKYKDSKKESYITKTWTKDKSEVLSDISCFGNGRYDNIKIVAADESFFCDEINKGKRKRWVQLH